MKALIQEGVIERVSVPKTHEQIGAASHVECFRLVPESGGKDIGNVTPILVDDDANELGDRFGMIYSFILAFPHRLQIAQKALKAMSLYISRYQT